MGVTCTQLISCLSRGTSRASLCEKRISSHLLWVFFLSALLCLSTATRSEGKQYTDKKFSYTVSYPNHWFPSGITYANAFEIRNYDPKNPQSVPERNRTSVIIVNTVNENAENTEKFLNGLLGGESKPEQEHRALTIDEHRAVRVRRKVPAQQLGPGTSRATASNVPADQSQFFFSIGMYIANGKHMIALEASAPTEADAAVIGEIIKIEESVKFEKSATK